MLAATHSVNTLTMGHPIVLIIGPANFSPYPYKRTAPVSIEIIENEIAKFENPPISRKSC
jgi:hypothetical protein